MKVFKQMRDKQFRRTLHLGVLIAVFGLLALEKDKLSSKQQAFSTPLQVFSKTDKHEILSSSSSLFYPSDTPDAFFNKVKAAVNTTTFPKQVTLVKSDPPFFACNAPKTGCTAWKYFWEYVDKGKRWNSSEIEKHPGMIHIYNGVKNSSALPSHYLDQISEMVVFVRNPYVRFLSSYQDWLARAQTNETSVPFGVFVDEYLKVKEGHGNTDFFEGRTLWNHIESVSKFCKVGTQNALVVRVEEEALWINQFLRKYNLTEKMDQYVKHGNSVYSSGLQEGSLVKDFALQISGRLTWPSEQMKSSHYRDSLGKITKYYTPDIARKVTNITFDDLINFGYPLWNGIADNFRLT